jgi:hypothetical protein
VRSKRPKKSTIIGAAFFPCSEMSYDDWMRAGGLFRLNSGATRTQVERHAVLGFAEEQPRQHGNRKSMPPMAPFRQSVFR